MRVKLSQLAVRDRINKQQVVASGVVLGKAWMIISGTLLYSMFVVAAMETIGEPFNNPVAVGLLSSALLIPLVLLLVALAIFILEGFGRRVDWKRPTLFIVGLVATINFALEAGGII